jgi:tetratricopeptide (TPR) repeat protein
VGFLPADVAQRQLYEAARNSARQELRSSGAPSDTVKIELEAHSIGALRAQAETLADDFRAYVQSKELESTPQGSALDAGVFEDIQITPGGRLTWSAGNRLTAFVSIAAAASHIRGPDTWELVSRGYEAFGAGEYEQAIEAYDRALERNPFDVATHCRRAAAMQASGDLDSALAGFTHAYERLTEVGDPYMKAWCLFGLAEVADATGSGELATQAALQLLSVPTTAKRAELALTMLRAAPAGRARASDPLPFEALSKVHLDAHGMRFDPSVIRSSMDRIVQVVVPAERRTMAQSEAARVHTRDCTLPRRRRFNRRRCEGLEERTCTRDECNVHEYRSCTGVLAAPDRVSVSSTCIGIIESADQFAAEVHVIRHRLDATGWRSTTYVPDRIDTNDNDVVHLYLAKNIEGAPEDNSASSDSAAYVIGFPFLLGDSPVVYEPTVLRPASSGLEGMPVFDRRGRWIEF